MKPTAQRIEALRKAETPAGWYAHGGGNYQLAIRLRDTGLITFRAIGGGFEATDAGRAWLAEHDVAKAVPRAAPVCKGPPCGEKMKGVPRGWTSTYNLVAGPGAGRRFCSAACRDTWKEPATASESGWAQSRIPATGVLILRVDGIERARVLCAPGQNMTLHFGELCDCTRPLGHADAEDCGKALPQDVIQAAGG